MVKIQTDEIQKPKPTGKVVKIFPKPGGPNHMYCLDMPYNKGLTDQLKVYPGFEFDFKGLRKWECGEDVLGLIVAELEERNYQVKVERRKIETLDRALIDDRLKPFQKDGVEFLWKNNGGILCYDTGTGKTVTTIGFVKIKDYTKLLVVTDSNVKQNWLEHIGEFWQEYAGEIHILETEKQCKEFVADSIPGWAIVSYKLSVKLKGLAGHWDSIIWDEFHGLQDPFGVQAKANQVISLSNKGAVKIALSATPVGKDVKSVYRPIEVIRPGTFGSGGHCFNRFCDRYSLKVPCAHSPKGFIYEGQNESNAKELFDRIAAFTHRVTHDDASEFLPEAITKKVWVEKEKGLDHKGILAKLKAGQTDKDGFDAAVEECSNIKMKVCVDLGMEKLAKGERVCFGVHHHKISDALELELKARIKALPKGDPIKNQPVVRVDGRTPIARRDVILESAKIKNAILILGMEAVKTGINTLVYWNNPIAAELPWKHNTLVQFYGRFPRMNITERVVFTIPLVQGTIDEIIMNVVQERLTANNKVVPGGKCENEIRDSLGTMTDGDMVKALQMACESFVEEEEWL